MAHVPLKWPDLLKKGTRTEFLQQEAENGRVYGIRSRKGSLRLRQKVTVYSYKPGLAGNKPSKATPTRVVCGGLLEVSG